MEKLTELATSIYGIAKDYKDYFCSFKSNKKTENKDSTKNRKLAEYLKNFYNSQQLYNFVKEDEESSINEIKKQINENYGIMRLYNIIENNISATEELDKIDIIYKFLYDVMSLEKCCDIAIKKYGKKYKKYCDLYIKMQKVEKDLLDYLKEICKEN